VPTPMPALLRFLLVKGSETIGQCAQRFNLAREELKVIGSVGKHFIDTESALMREGDRKFA